MSSTKPREVYLPIHAIQCSDKSRCPYYEVIRSGEEPEAVCVAYCKATNNYLTKHFVKRCIAYWETCPFKQVLNSQFA